MSVESVCRNTVKLNSISAMLFIYLLREIGFVAFYFLFFSFVVLGIELPE